MKTKNMIMSILAIAPVVLSTASVTSLAAENVTANSKVTANIESGGATLSVEDFDLGTAKIGGAFAEQQQSDTLVQVRDKTGGKGYAVSGKMKNYAEINPTLNITMNLSDNGDYAITSEDVKIIDSATGGDHDYAGKFTTTWGDNPTVGQKVANMTWTLTPITYRVVQKGMWGTAPVELDEDGVLHVYAGVLSSNGSNGYVDNDKTISKSDVYEIVFEDVVKAPSDSSYLFSGYSDKLKFSNLTKMNTEKLDVSDVTRMGSMFSGASSLTTLDLSNWDTSNVTDMIYMFSGTKSLTTLDVSSWDTSNVTNMKMMFSNAKSLTTLDVSNWDTSNVTDMIQMFYYASSLTTLDVSNWDTSNVEVMTSMFSGTESLTTLKLGNRTQLLSDCSLPNGFALENSDIELVLPFTPEGLGGTGIAGVYTR